MADKRTMAMVDLARFLGTKRHARHHHIHGIALGAEADTVERVLGPPARQDNGWLRYDFASFLCESGVVKRIAIRDSHSLDSLSFSSVDDVMRYVGRPDSRRASRGDVRLLYLSRDLHIVASLQPFAVKSVVLGIPPDRDNCFLFAGALPAQLVSVQAERIYKNLFEGLPTTKGNDAIIAQALARAKRLHPESSVFLVEPERTPIHRKRNYPFGCPERLPGVCFIGSFKSDCCVADENADGSQAVVVWFGDELEIPGNGAWTKVVPWRDFAADFEW